MKNSVLNKIVHYVLVQNKWFLSALGMFMILFALITIKSSKSPSITYHPTVKQYVVEASPAKMWKDSNKSLSVVLAVLIIVGLPYAYLKYNESKGNDSNAGVILIIWVIGFFIFFSRFTGKWGDSSYTTTLTEQEFDAGKGNLDGLFPRIDKQ